MSKIIFTTFTTIMIFISITMKAQIEYKYNAVVGKYKFQQTEYKFIGGFCGNMGACPYKDYKQVEYWNGERIVSEYKDIDVYDNHIFISLGVDSMRAYLRIMLEPNKESRQSEMYFTYFPTKYISIITGLGKEIKCLDRGILTSQNFNGSDQNTNLYFLTKAELNSITNDGISSLYITIKTKSGVFFEKNFAFTKLEIDFK
jgi:hypothetical protein